MMTEIKLLLIGLVNMTTIMVLFMALSIKMNSMNVIDIQWFKSEQERNIEIKKMIKTIKFIIS